MQKIKFSKQGSEKQEQRQGEKSRNLGGKGKSGVNIKPCGIGGKGRIGDAVSKVNLRGIGGNGGFGGDGCNIKPL
jgi:hypothetical protein